MPTCWHFKKRQLLQAVRLWMSMTQLPSQRSSNFEAPSISWRMKNDWNCEIEKWLWKAKLKPWYNNNNHDIIIWLRVALHGKRVALLSVHITDWVMHLPVEVYTYSVMTWASLRLKSPATHLFVQHPFRLRSKIRITGPLWGEFTGDRWKCQ